jgi:cyclopropane fatty-acyl-phospholipid synthase-like methyltransferase
MARVIHLEERSVWKRLLRDKTNTIGLGLDLKPGDEHYRAYVGPPKDYDLVSAMVFNLLTCVGLRQHHRVLDIGCGSLRVGRLLIPYLNPQNYYGVEPNKWLVDDGIENEVGRDLVKIKEPIFSFHASLEEFEKPLNLDYAIAQSVFSHCGKDLIKGWLSQVSFHLNDSGVLLATFLIGEKDYNGDGWVYPGCVNYKPETISEIASEFALDFDVLDWAHPRQTWALFSKKKYDKSLIHGGPITWNRFVEKALSE